MNKKTKKTLDIKVSVKHYSKNNNSFAGSPGSNSSNGGFYGNSANSSS